MAVAVPIIMSMTGASAAIGAALGVSATMVTVGTGVLMAATGAGAAINKAASKVFGEDLVQIGNIAGAAFLAFGGGAAGAAEGAADAASGLDAAAEAGAGATDALTAAAESTDILGTAAQSVAEEAGALGGSLSGGGAAAFDPATTGVLAQAAAPLDAGASAAKAPTSILKPDASLVDKFKALPERTQAALVQVGGNMVAGAAQGYAQGKQIEEEREEQRRRDERFRTGSGLRVGHNYTYGPRRGVLTREG